VAALIPYITDSKQKAWLEKLCNKENSHGFKEFMSSDCKSVFSLLTSELRNCCDIPLADLLHMLPSMQPRYYTISSSSSLHPQSVHITVSVTEFATPSGGVFEGLTSGYTRYLEAGSEVRAFIRPSSFRLPKKHQTPIIMIGPGTGLAPMRALLQERRYRHAQSKSGVPGKNTLYFGCKYSDIDYIYRDELMDYSSEELTLHTAFSRETSGSKTYVQHLMQRPDDAKALVEDIVDNGAYVFVCGATAMGADVHNTLIQLFKTSKGYSQERAVAYLAELSKGGRYIQELWSA
jgi:NADPH-ferrihemoprotein reductase